MTAPRVPLLGNGGAGLRTLNDYLRASALGPADPPPGGRPSPQEEQQRYLEALQEMIVRMNLRSGADGAAVPEQAVARQVPDPTDVGQLPEYAGTGPAPFRGVRVPGGPPAHERDAMAWIRERTGDPTAVYQHTDVRNLQPLGRR